MPLNQFKNFAKHIGSIVGKRECVMNVSNNMAPVVIHAILDAIKFNQALLKSETLRDVGDHESIL
jgi:hypothetical protein